MHAMSATAVGLCSLQLVVMARTLCSMSLHITAA
jgi:hypothetical protein